MDPAQLKDWYRRYVDEVFNARNLDAADRYWRAGFTNHDGPPDVAPGVDGVKQTLRAWFEAFPDAHITVEDVVVEGRQLVARLVIEGTHAGEFLGVPATGARLRLREIAWYRLDADHMMTDIWPVLWDIPNVFHQVRDAALRALQAASG